MESLKDIAHELDHSLGGINAHLEELEALETELGHVSEDVVNTDISSLEDMGMRFRDINHKVIIISSLLRYLLNDLRKDYKKSDELKSILFDKVVRQEQQNEKDN